MHTMKHRTIRFAVLVRRWASAPLSRAAPSMAEMEALLIELQDRMTEMHNQMPSSRRSWPR